MIEASALTVDLGGIWHQHYGSAPCPVCQPEGRRDQKALSLRNGEAGRLLLHCHKSNCTFGDIIMAAGLSPRTETPREPGSGPCRETSGRTDGQRRAARARDLWDEGLTISGTPAEAYLRRRGITCPLPHTLRFSFDCWHASGTRHPALVALVEGGSDFAVHRTYLRPDGSGRARIERSKAMLGPVAGGAVRLGDHAGPLAVAEGIETALSLRCGLLGESATVWAALSTSGMRRLMLPSKPDQLIVAPDGDGAGRDAAHELANRAHGLGWHVSVLDVPEGRDCNDLLQKGVMA